jgi:hypothetical protein
LMFFLAAWRCLVVAIEASFCSQRGANSESKTAPPHDS